MCDLDSQRIVGIELKCQTFGSIFIFGVYLPLDEIIDKYKDELNMLDILYSYYNNYGTVIIAGDMNASCFVKDNAQSNRFKSVELLNFVKRHSFQVVGNNFNHKGPDFSFTTKCTMLNYVIFNECLGRQLVSYEILAGGSISSTTVCTSSRQFLLF